MHPSVVIFSLSLCTILLTVGTIDSILLELPSHLLPLDSRMWRDDAGESVSCLLIMACGSVLINLPHRKDLSLRKCESAGNL